MDIPIVSICIPTYNSSGSLELCIESLAYAKNHQFFEVVVVDDCSEDGTYELACNMLAGYSNAILSKNAINLGMDKNFLETVTLSSGKYIWFSGQDDLLGEDVLKRVEDVLLKAPEIGIINCNFSQYNHSYETCLMKSFFDIASFKDFHLKKIESDLIMFDSPSQYFQIFTQPPSFLPSVVMLREYFFRCDPTLFFGTYFLQVGVLLVNMHLRPIAAILTPFIKGRLPDNQWQSDGTKLLAIMTGDLVAKTRAFALNNTLPMHILHRDLAKYSLNFPFLLSICYDRGLVSPAFVNDLLIEISFGNSFLALYLVGVSRLNRHILRWLVILMKPCKKMLLLVAPISRLRG